MRAEDLLPDHLDQGQFNGVTVRKGTVGAFLFNARTWCDPATPGGQRLLVEQDMLQALPALKALGLFEVLQVRDPELARLLK
ncbi:hypothetical protein [Pseudomonas yamanorum]|uniref:hypothetical protein n=1 Tax=Pseudomonas yamanorum TaxID=515393 RepID=UPI003B9E25D9